MITEDYVSFETAKLLKEKGFDEPILSVYTSDHKPFISCVLMKCATNVYPRVTLQMAMKWLRETHKIEIRVIYDNEELSWYGACNPINESFQILLGFGRKSKSYEEACEEAIRYCLEKLV